jgi:hypothetical protein
VTPTPTPMRHPMISAAATAAAKSTLAAVALSLVLLGGGRAWAAADEPAPASSPSQPQPSPFAAGAAPGGAVATTPAALASTDHDLVVGHVGLEARRIAATPYPLALRPSGCPTVTPAPPCTVDLGALGVRYWKTRNLAWNAALALAFGGGRQGPQALDTYYGVGPIVGLTLLLGSWRHLAVGASPEASFIYFKPSGGAGPGTKLIAVRGQLEGELHFGFVDVPALSVGITTGLAFQYESAPGASTWSVSVGEARSVWGALTNLFIRYYL